MDGGMAVFYLERVIPEAFSEAELKKITISHHAYKDNQKNLVVIGEKNPSKDKKSASCGRKKDKIQDTCGWILENTHVMHQQFVPETKKGNKT